MDIFDVDNQVLPVMVAGARTRPETSPRFFGCERVVLATPIDTEREWHKPQDMGVPQTKNVTLFHSRGNGRQSIPSSKDHSGGNEGLQARKEKGISHILTFISAIEKLRGNCQLWLAELAQAYDFPCGCASSGFLEQHIDCHRLVPCPMHKC